MNRLKVWLFVLLVGAAAVAAVRFTAVAERGLATRALDARLQAASAQLGLAVRALSDQTSSVAALTARDAKLVELLHAKEAAPPHGRKVPPPVDPAAEEAAIQAAARAALAAAEQAAGFSLSETTQIVGVNREALARKAQEAGEGEKALVDALGAAVGGEVRRGFLRWSGKLWYSAAVPAGEGAGLVLLQPVDGEWLRAATSGTGTDLILIAPDHKPLATSGRDVAELAAVASRAGAEARAVGRLAPAFTNALGFRIAKPSLLFLDGAPAYRALAFPVAGLAGGSAVAVAPTATLLAPVLETQWTLLAGTLAVVVIGLLFGLLVRPAEVAAPVPPELLAAADKIRRGDFATRAPVLAGQLGTVSEAMNRAVDAAAAAAAAGAPAPSLTQEFFAGGEKPAQAPTAEPSAAFEFPARPSPRVAAAAAEAEPAFAAAPALGGGAFEAAPVPAPARAIVPPAPPATVPPAIVPPAPPSQVASAPELLQAAARAAPPAEAGGEEEHWREVFQDFLRVRTQCGEPAEGLTFERFRAKLESNKATLVAKYACRTVRFQVYVKEGKAALKATPVR